MVRRPRPELDDSSVLEDRQDGKCGGHDEEGAEAACKPEVATAELTPYPSRLALEGARLRDQPFALVFKRLKIWRGSQHTPQRLFHHADDLLRCVFDATDPAQALQTLWLAMRHQECL